MEFFHVSQFFHPPRGVDPMQPMVGVSFPTEVAMGYVRAADEEDGICVALSSGPVDDEGNRLPARSVVLSACADDHFRGRHYVMRWLAKPFVFNRRNIKIIKELSGGYVVE